jgi:hypothetical protein
MRPYLISCPLESLKSLPKSVSLTTKPCGKAENNMAIIKNLPENEVKKRFGVFTKQTIFESREYAPRFVEWVEMLRILGASKIHIYVKFVHPEMKKILDYYEEIGVMEVLPFLEPSGVPTTVMHSYQDMLLQMNILNDCFYRYRNMYDFLVLIDPDELIVPVQANDRTWEDILLRANLTEKRDCYRSQNVYYPETEAKLFPDIPKHNYMLQHVLRSVNMPPFGHNVKSFYLPEKIIVIHNHYALFSYYSGLRGSWLGDIPVNISQNSHYRDKVEPKFQATVEDKTLWKYRDELMEAVDEVLGKFEVFDESDGHQSSMKPH